MNAESPFFGRVRYGDFTHETAFTEASLRQVLGAGGFASFHFREDSPAVHGVLSAGRRLAWILLRPLAILWLVAESGPGARRAILSQNLVCVAVK